MAGAFGKKRVMGTRERSEIFQSRRAKLRAFNFVEVDHAVLLAALNTAILAGATISFAPAQGGIGCTLRVYKDETADTEFAGSPEELEELLGMFINALSSKSEDAVLVARAELMSRYPTT